MDESLAHPLVEDGSRCTLGNGFQRDDADVIGSARVIEEVLRQIHARDNFVIADHPQQRMPELRPSVQFPRRTNIVREARVAKHPKRASSHAIVGHFSGCVLGCQQAQEIAAQRERQGGRIAFGQQHKGIALRQLCANLGNIKRKPRSNCAQRRHGGRCSEHCRKQDVDDCANGCVLVEHGAKPLGCEQFLRAAMMEANAPVTSRSEDGSALKGRDFFVSPVG